MTETEAIKCLIHRLRPRAKFVAVEPIQPSENASDDDKDAVHFVSLYDSRIDSNVVKSRFGPIIIGNSYLSSFAYNVLLCWLVQFSEKSPKSAGKTATLLKHNFKKFFAEQMLNIRNNIFARAVFLETLLFEQILMEPVGDIEANDTPLRDQARLGAHLMRGIVLDHELAHFILERTPSCWDTAVAVAPDALLPVFSQIQEIGSESLIQEFKCDVMAVFSCFDRYKGEHGPEFALRVVVFAFATFAVLSSLAKSADETMRLYQSIPDEVDFSSIRKQVTEYRYVRTLDHQFIERAKHVIGICRRIADLSGISLFNQIGPLPITASILEDSLLYVQSILDSNDGNARKMSLLVAESLHEHNQGLEYLFMRSKRFLFGDERSGSFDSVQKLWNSAASNPAE